MGREALSVGSAPEKEDPAALLASWRHCISEVIRTPDEYEASPDGSVDILAASLDVETLLKWYGSNAARATLNGPLKYKVLDRLGGRGAPWEIHRPQHVVRQLVQRGAFAGRVLDAGCGIGDNSLYIAKACPGASVTAVDAVERCVKFGEQKARLRGMAGRVAFAVANLGEAGAGGLRDRTAAEPYDVVLDSYTYDTLTDEERGAYVAALRQLLQPGGVVYLAVLSEDETRQGGPRRVSQCEVRSVFSPASGWAVEAEEETHLEVHPSFWGGKGRARLYTIRKAP
ncbi:hypothetical protein GPECTOR_57g454 [Gonium pectorale]|uniref:Methyltransferase domain-containing protein n=1 Tax=Gonium pectorale TaxID=33097 RepID=A0A150G5R8_GONPE|nr:hypothetical protein GPECTOR_57g454 [Gonium pectorale]|eukprot:KXZ45164.1 hypothetical protein GPECTOR_57g454 [Gonium pectorale]